MPLLKLDRYGHPYQTSGDLREPVYPRQEIPFIDNRFMHDRRHDYNLKKAEQKAQKKVEQRKQRAKRKYQHALLMAQIDFRQKDIQIKKQRKKVIAENHRRQKHLIPALAQGINAIDYEQLYITGCPLTADGQHSPDCGHLQRNSIFGTPTDYKKIENVPQAEDFGNTLYEED